MLKLMELLGTEIKGWDVGARMNNVREEWTRSRKWRDEALHRYLILCLIGSVASPGEEHKQARGSREFITSVQPCCHTSR